MNGLRPSGWLKQRTEAAHGPASSRPQQWGLSRVSNVTCSIYICCTLQDMHWQIKALIIYCVSQYIIYDQKHFCQHSLQCSTALVGWHISHTMLSSNMFTHNYITKYNCAEPEQAPH